MHIKHLCLARYAHQAFMFNKTWTSSIHAQQEMHIKHSCPLFSKTWIWRIMFRKTWISSIFFSKTCTTAFMFGKTCTSSIYVQQDMHIKSSCSARLGFQAFMFIKSCMFSKICTSSIHFQQDFDIKHSCSSRLWYQAFMLIKSCTKAFMFSSTWTVSLHF